MHRRFVTHALAASATALFSVAALSLAGPAAAATMGAPAPDFQLKDATGKTVKLADFKGKHVVLE